MEQQEIRLKLIEIAARTPHNAHPSGHAAGVLETVKLWENYVNPPVKTLGVPKK